LGNYISSDFYHVFHKRKCYELSVSIASSSFANFDPSAIKEFTREDEKRKGFRATLRLSWIRSDS
jgi:hypothetical protein